MRELTRSLASFSWALSLFGVEQMANLLSPRRAAEAFSTVAGSAEGTLGPSLRSVFETGDRLQRAVVDASFGLLGAGPSAGADPAPGAGGSDLLNRVGNLAFELLQLGVTTVYSATGTAWQQQQGLPGWGPVQPPAAGPRE